MVGRFVDLLKYSILAFVLLTLPGAVGCGDNATVEPEVVTEEGGEDDPTTMVDDDLAPPEN